MLLVMVTYTHNDAGLLNDLLGSMRRWSVKPAHVFIVDDASEQLYALPGELKEDFGGSAALSAQAENSPKRGTPLPGLDVLRPGERMGPAQAKSFGISLAFDAGADVVLSVDCDVRLPRHWLKEALHMTCQEKVGLVGSDLRHGLAGDALSDYLREFEATPHGIVETPFLEAGVWVLRKDAWLAGGGLTGHTQYTHEDLYLSNMFTSLGYTRIAHNDPPGTQVRRLRARSHFNRQLRYLGFAVLEVAQSRGIDAALSLIAGQTAERLARAKELNRPDFFYIELLWISSLLLYLAARGGMKGNPAAAYAAVGKELKNFSRAYPETENLLQEDLSAMSLAGKDFPLACPENKILAEPDADGSASALSKEILGLWARYPEMLQELEKHEISRIREEDENMNFLPHYLE